MANALAPNNTFLKPETARATGLKSEPVVQGEVVRAPPIQTVAAPAPPPAVVVSNQPRCTPGQGVPPRAQPGGMWTSDPCRAVPKYNA